MLCMNFTVEFAVVVGHFDEDEKKKKKTIRNYTGRSLDNMAWNSFLLIPYLLP